MSAKILAVRGTRDFYPPQMAFRNWLYGHIRTVSEKYGYQEWEAPILETLELYAAKSGEELVKEQAFVFEDRGGTLVALRPELTPSLARMVAQQAQQLPQPIRWWSFGPFWRYERPQKGRAREFFQWNLDLLGSESVSADAEVASVAAELLAALGLKPTQVTFKVNSRGFMERRVSQLGVVAVSSGAIFSLIDRIDKLSPEKWAAYGLEIGLEEKQLTALRDMLADREQWRQSEQLSAFFQAVDALGTSEWFEFDASVVRGLDYYTGVVFEARDTAGKHRAILGGGRYDNLVADVGGEPIPATGFAMGDVVVGLVAHEADVTPQLPACRTQVLVTVFADEFTVQSMDLARELRASDLRVEIFPEAAKLQKQLRYADRQGIPLAVVLGPDELERGEVSLKELRSGEQRRLPRTVLVAGVRALLDSDSPS
jgi:histidyl-tRNA synthetase